MMKMTCLKISFSIITSLVLGLLLFKTIAIPQKALAAPPQSTCQVGTFFGLVPWYAYFNPADFNQTNCTLDLKFVNQADGTANANNINKIWLIGLAIFEDLLRIAGFIAIVFIIYGGIRYVTSQGEPENTKAARSTIINALIGAAIAMIAAVSVSFLGATLGKP